MHYAGIDVLILTLQAFNFNPNAKGETMAIRHMISNPVTILTPSRDGRIWIQYQDGRKAEVEITELHADGDWQEINWAINGITANWQWTDEWMGPNWHAQGTAA